MAEAPPVTAVVQPQRGIGDTIWHLPYLRAIAQRARDNQVLLITKPATGARELLAGEPAVAEVLYLEEHRGPLAYAARTLELLHHYRHRAVERVVILDKVSAPALAARLAGVPERYGFGTRRTQLRWLSQKEGIDPALHRAHPLEKLPAFMALMGWGPVDPEPRLQAPAAAREAVLARLAALSRPWFGIGIGASSPERVWPPERTAAICAWLLGATGGSVLLFGGPGDQELGAAIRRRTGAEAITARERLRDLCGRLPLDQAAAAMAECRLFFGMDSGPMNMAAGLGVTTFGMFATSIPLHHSRHLHPILTDDGRHGVAGGIARVSVNRVIRQLEPYIH